MTNQTRAQAAPPPGGLVVVDKPRGMTSHDVVARVRRLAATRRVGHAGTLDPMATGVLVLGVERATRLLGHLALTDKAYDATIRLGVSTVTDDAEGEPLATVPAGHLADADIAAALRDLTGDIAQVPSAVSAVKVEGRRAYARVRAGENVELAPRPVSVHQLTLSAARRTSEVIDLDVEVVCSSGTYVRAIARDLGLALGVGGHLTRLRRTRAGPYDLSTARTLEQLEESLELVPLASAARQRFPVWNVDDRAAVAVGHGAQLPWPDDVPAHGPVAVFGPDGRFLALAERRSGRAKLLAVFV